ncbi:GlsB/YeaQ/YmgE family stress response membrane protein [Mycetocola tolaasinivorans]|uniref:GlsB/YeaQ/YmgE family stress response membrane protein n=1 Tax=Mycetocola tolaasinivorans TaxID=76635 RepID=A0A3L6ZZP4_9MICO|nr:GlsB/YeaQ/YmgE family stress response membrane protein [Mycetocola tolaasinivorans]RLP73198.1 GlsB/YeaQ/YmgE family stress response membrane protein [Mycetocola tolaasinivorans]
MGFFAFLILGLIAGAIAKAILPGKQNGGWFATLILGVVGAVVGGWIGSLLFNAKIESFWNLGSWALAIVGSIVVLLIYGAITGRKKA